MPSLAFGHEDPAAARIEAEAAAASRPEGVGCTKYFRSNSVGSHSPGRRSGFRYPCAPAAARHPCRRGRLPAPGFPAMLPEWAHWFETLAVRVHPAVRATAAEQAVRLFGEIFERARLAADQRTTSAIPRSAAHPNTTSTTAHFPAANGITGLPSAWDSGEAALLGQMTLLARVGLSSRSQVSGRYWMKLCDPFSTGLLIDPRNHGTVTNQ